MKISKKSNVLIISHFSKRSMQGGGPPQEIRDYLLPKVKSIYYIEHPFPYSKDHRSSMTIYKDGVLIKQIFTPQVFGPDAIFYILDIFITFYFLLKARVLFDLCIALDNLNTVSVLPFKKLGIIKMLVFYTIDYIPTRFKNKILNNLYHLTDRVACYNADKIWVLSERMIKARNENKISYKKSAKNIILPMGANLSRINVLPIKKINRYNMVFAGIILKKQGIQLIIEALPEIILKVPKVKLTIIGQGEYEQELKVLAKNFNVSKYVEFKGFIKDHRIVEKILCKSAIGIAPYVPTPDNYTFYTDPGKPKLYLGCGLPVIITNVPAIAKEIKQHKAGLIIEFTKSSAVNAVVKLLLDNDFYENLRKNAIKLSKNYDTNTLITNAFNKT